MNLKQYKGYLGEFRGRREKGKIIQLYYNLNKIKYFFKLKGAIL